MDVIELQETNKAGKILSDKNLQIIFAVSLMSIMGVSSITPALPEIARKLNIPKENIGLLITAFTIPGAVIAPIIGILSDRYGRKNVLVPSLFLFGLAGGACAFARSVNILLLLRFLQGIGGAALSILNVTIIGDIYTGNSRAAALGYNSSVIQIGAAGYPLVGGALAVLGWNFPFYIFFVSLIIGLLVLFFLQNPENRNNQSMKDYLNNSAKSLMNRKVLCLLIVSIITFIIFYGTYLTYFPVFLVEKYNASALLIGIIMSFMPFTTALTAFKLNSLAKRFETTTLIKISFIFYGTGLLMLSYVSNIFACIIPIIILGMGHGLSIPCILNLLAALAPAEYRAAFMSINGMLFRLGQTIGPVIMGAIYGLGGINSVFIAGVICAALTLGITIVGLKS